ncbi:MAG: N-acetylmuramoyl-L-alanine amidase [Pseudomonadota bacterium]
MRAFTRFCFVALAAVLLCVTGRAEALDLTLTEADIRSAETGIDLELGLTRGVPFRIALYDGPPRLAVFFGGAVHSQTDEEDFVLANENGETRLLRPLPSPMAVERAAMTVALDGSARLSLRLRRVSRADFKQIAQPAPEPEQGLPTVQEQPSRLTVALDPGHGGHDPGATHGQIHESDLVLSFARELKEDLLRTTDFDVVLTRNEDRFVPLKERIGIAQETGADVFISLHADGIPRGSASGATVFTHGERASTPISERLAREHHRDALLAGVDLSGAGDALAVALMDLARQDSAHRSLDLADQLVSEMARADIPLYKHPRQQADFVVLRAPDIPAVLVELGFLSEPADRERLADPAWRAKMALALRRGLLKWTKSDAALAALRLR